MPPGTMRYKLLGGYFIYNIETGEMTVMTKWSGYLFS